MRRSLALAFAAGCVALLAVAGTQAPTPPPAHAVALQAADRDGVRSRVVRTRLVARVPATFDCKTRPYGAYPSKCLGDATPPMGD